MLDIFRSDMFSVTSLTEAILKAPFQPSRIQSLGLFRERGISTLSVIIEEKDGQLSLIQTTPRGGPGSQLANNKRRARSFVVPHLERNATIYADEVQGVRVFGSENETETVQAKIDEKLMDLRAMHEVTLEYQRVGAIKGLILDADGSTLFDLFTEFGVSQQTYGMDIDTGAMEVRRQCIEIQRLIEAELGAEPVASYRALCGDDFFDALMESESIKSTLQYQESQALRVDVRKGFEFGGITWENYRGSVNGTDFFESDEAYVIPQGTNVFTTYFAPADFMETVNTLGKRMYAKSFVDQELQRWTKIHAQSNPLSLNLRPRTVVQLSLST